MVIGDQANLLSAFLSLNAISFFCEPWGGPLMQAHSEDFLCNCLLVSSLDVLVANIYECTNSATQGLLGVEQAWPTRDAYRALLSGRNVLL
ncbi:MAG: hypothetical protein ACI8X5_003909 [Planctomycetota bacterium]|jgi:hypothetical protein